MAKSNYQLHLNRSASGRIIASIYITDFSCDTLCDMMTSFSVFCDGTYEEALQKLLHTLKRKHFEVDDVIDLLSSKNHYYFDIVSNEPEEVRKVFQC